MGSYVVELQNFDIEKLRAQPGFDFKFDLKAPVGAAKYCAGMRIRGGGVVLLLAPTPIAALFACKCRLHLGPSLLLCFHAISTTKQPHTSCDLPTLHAPQGQYGLCNSAYGCGNSCMASARGAGPQGMRLSSRRQSRGQSHP